MILCGNGILLLYSAVEERFMLTNTSDSVITRVFHLIEGKKEKSGMKNDETERIIKAKSRL